MYDVTFMGDWVLESDVSARPYSYPRYRTVTNLQPRVMQGVFSNANDRKISINSYSGVEFYGSLFGFFYSHKDKITCLRFTPNGLFLWSVEEKGIHKTWSVESNYKFIRRGVCPANWWEVFLKLTIFHVTLLLFQTGFQGLPSCRLRTRLRSFVVGWMRSVLKKQWPAWSMTDHANYAHSLSSCGIEPEKNSGLKGIRTHGFCDTSAVLHQLSYQPNWKLITQWVRNIPVEGKDYKWTCERSYIWTAEKNMTTWLIIAVNGLFLRYPCIPRLGSCALRAWGTSA